MLKVTATMGANVPLRDVVTHARRVEGLGYDTLSVAEAVHDGMLSSMAALGATTRLRVQTNVLVLAYRNPFLSAKAAASLDALSGGRLILGVAAGYLKSEYRALGADFEHRNELCDEAITAIQHAWSEDGVAMTGRGFEARGKSQEWADTATRP